MSFVPRNFEQIRDDMLAYIRTQTLITDFQVGSVARTFVEAAALEDDEQYFQMVQLLDAFRISTSTGALLDGRLQEFDLIRLQPGNAVGEIVIQDGTLITSFLSFDEAAGALSIQLEDSSSFPTAGFPYTVRIGEGTIAVEDVSVTANNVGTNTLTIGATASNHSAGDRVSFVSGLADIALTPGIRVERPATAIDPVANRYTSVESGTLVNGNYESTPIRVQAEVPGIASNVGAGQLTRFVGAPPFDGALVTNKTATNGGRELESDDDFRDRGLNRLQTLSNATVLTLREAALGVEDPVTGQSVVSANVLEVFSEDEVVVYIDDGTGFIPDQIDLARSSLAVAVAAPVGVLTVDDASEFPAEGFIIVSPEDPAQSEFLEYSDVDYGTNVITLVGVTANAHDIGDEVAVVDALTESAEPGQNFFNTQELPIVRNSFRLWIDSGGGPVFQAEGTDYLLNRGTGQIELLGSGAAAGAIVFANYTYYTNLVAEVQRVINGVSEDEVNFPGVSAAGIVVVVETPIIRRITVRLSISAQSGFDEDDLIPEVQEVVEQYITGLGIGEDVIIAEIVERAMGVAGMYNVVVSVPTSDVTILEDELPVPFSASGDSLVSVS